VPFFLPPLWHSVPIPKGIGARKSPSCSLPSPALTLTLSQRERGRNPYPCAPLPLGEPSDGGPQRTIGRFEAPQLSQFWLECTVPVNAKQSSSTGAWLESVRQIKNRSRPAPLEDGQKQGEYRNGLTLPQVMGDDKRECAGPRGTVGCVGRRRSGHACGHRRAVDRTCLRHTASTGSAAGGTGPNRAGCDPFAPSRP
jgi:hypothetical protein